MKIDEQIAEVERSVDATHRCALANHGRSTTRLNGVGGRLMSMEEFISDLQKELYSLRRRVSKLERE